MHTASYSAQWIEQRPQKIFVMRDRPSLTHEGYVQNVIGPPGFFGQSLLGVGPETEVLREM